MGNHSLPVEKLLWLNAPYLAPVHHQSQRRELQLPPQKPVISFRVYMWNKNEEQGKGNKKYRIGEKYRIGGGRQNYRKVEEQQKLEWRILEKLRIGDESRTEWAKLKI